jgi:cellulose synthase/poly-beta-1,6-N-acetylglucosamine synthase-like glycosyltransferase
VPAHNEERVIAEITRDLLGQSYPNLEVIVIAHNCADETAQIVGAIVDPRLTVYELQTEEVGKAIPLNFAFGKARGSIIAQFDADNQIQDQRMVEKAVRYFADDSVDAIQGKLETKNPNVNLLTKFQQLEFAIWSYIFWAGKNVINSPSPIAGTNAFFRKEVIGRIELWDQELVEDFALYLKLASFGAKIVYAPDVVSSDEKPATWSSLVKQRKRWVRGTFNLVPKWLLKRLPFIDKLYMIIPFWMILWYITTAVCLGSGLLFGQLAFWYLPASVWVGQTILTYSLISVILRKANFSELTKYLPLYYVYSFNGFLVPFFILRNVNWANTKTDHG